METTKHLRRFRPYLSDLLAVLLLIALPPLVFWQVWSPNPADRVMFGGDILMGAYPTRVYIHQLFAQGLAPLWNPYQLGGMPLLGDVQTAPYYLPNLLLDLLYRGRQLSYLAFELLVIAHYALGAVFLYGYLRNLGLRPAAALVGAIGFEFNGFFVGHRGHYNMLAVVVWLPGVLWMLDRAWSAVGRRAAVVWAVTAGLALSQLVMAGHPQVTLYCALLIAAYAAYRWAGALRQGGGWRARLRIPALFVLAGGLAAGIAAITLLPAAELLSRSLRSDPSYDFTTQYSLLPRNLVGLLVPEFLGWSTTEFRIYAGVLTLLLAAVAWIVPARPRPERRFFGIAAAIALVIALGGFTSVYGLIYRFVPGFDSIRVSSRAFYIANLALTVLAAFGAESLLAALAEAELQRLRKLARGALALLSVAALLSIGLYATLLSNYKPVGESFFTAANLFQREPATDTFGLLNQTANAYLLFVLLLAASTALLWMRASGRLTGRGLAGAAALLMGLDVATFAPYHDTIKADPVTARFTVKNYATALIDQHWKVADQQQLIDQLGRLPDGIRIDNAAEVLPDNYSAVYRAPFATGYNILDLQQRFALLTQWPNLSPSLRWDLLNVGYVLTAVDAKGPPETDAQLVTSNSQGQLWQRAHQPSYAQFSTRIRPAQTSIAINGLLDASQTSSGQPPVSSDSGQLHTTLQQLWPATVDPALYQVGQTGVRSPVDLSVLAGGPSHYSAVIVDGVTVSPHQRGMLLALIDPQTGTLALKESYDTHLSADQSDRLAAAINAAPDGTIVALATYEEGMAQLNDAARTALASLGARTDLKGKIGAAYALIGVKGAPAGTALERLDPAAAVTLDVGVGAQAAQPAADFASQLITYQPDRITLQVRNSAQGLLTVSEAVFPGWEAYVDGQPTPILRANGMQRAVILQPTTAAQPHEVTFAYRPLSARLGGAVTVCTLLLALSLLLAAAALALPRRKMVAAANGSNGMPDPLVSAAPVFVRPNPERRTPNPVLAPRRARSLRIGGAALVMLLLMWQVARADAPSVGHPAQQQIQLIMPALIDSEAEHASGAYIPGLGAVLTLDLLRGPNALADKTSYQGTRDWAIYMMQTFGPQLNAVPPDEKIALSVNFYDYGDTVYHQLVIITRAAAAADTGNYLVWLDGKPYDEAASQLGAAQPTGVSATPPPAPTAAPTGVVPAATAAPVTVPVAPVPAAPTGPISATLTLAGAQASVQDWTPVSGQWVFTDQGYGQTDQDKFDLITLLNRPVAGDFAFQANIKYVAGDMGGGIVFNAPNGDTKNGAQMISYTGKGGYLQWGVFDAAGVFQFKGGANVASGADGKWHTLAVQTAGTSYRISLDGVVIAPAVPLDHAPGGHIGLLASTSHVLFDNLKLESK